MNLPKWLQEARAREQKATPPDWTVDTDAQNLDSVRVCYTGNGGTSCKWCVALSGTTEDDGTWTEETRLRWEADAAFIAHARTDVRRLLAVADVAAKLADALESVEWHWDDPNDPRFCAVCGQTHGDGHAEGCAIQGALAAWRATTVRAMGAGDD